ncbi:hypothetical protein ES703_78596 [subsurface metagenome]
MENTRLKKFLLAVEIAIALELLILIVLLIEFLRG